MEVDDTQEDDSDTEIHEEQLSDVFRAGNWPKLFQNARPIEKGSQSVIHKGRRNLGLDQMVKEAENEVQRSPNEITYRTVIVRPDASENKDSHDGLRPTGELMKDHKGRTAALKSSVFKEAEIKEIRINRDRECIAIDVFKFSALPRLESITKIGNWSVKCSLPLREKIISGVIRRVPLEYTVNDIKSELETQNVKYHEVTRLTRKIGLDKNKNLNIGPGLANTMEENSTSVRIDFEAPCTLPERIILFYEVFKCHAFIRVPMRCFICQAFGHGSKTCRTKKVCCPKCSGPHISNDCTNDKPKCPNCQGEHFAFSRECPKLQRAKKIEKISSAQKISYSMAVKVISQKERKVKTQTFYANSPNNNGKINLTSMPKTDQINRSSTTAEIHAASTQLENANNNTKKNNGQNLSDSKINAPSLSDVCPPEGLRDLILNIHVLFKKKLKQKQFEEALLQTVINFLNPRQRRYSTCSNHLNFNSSFTEANSNGEEFTQNKKRLRSAAIDKKDQTNSQE